MKNLVRPFLFCLALGFSGSAMAQEAFDVAGVWTGEIYNDSTQKYIPFELAISRKSGELSGYSYTVFLIDSVENIGVKEVTVSEKKGLYIIKDKKLIDDNYSDRPAKGVYTTLELSHTQNDTADILSGRWFTNKTKQFYPLSGTVFVTKKRAIYQTRIVKRLSYLGLANKLSFVQPNHGNDAPATSKPAPDKPKEEEMITIVEPEMVIELPKKDTAKAIVIPKMDALAGILDSAIEKQSATDNSAKTVVVARQKEPAATRHIPRPGEEAPVTEKQQPTVSGTVRAESATGDVQKQTPAIQNPPVQSSGKSTDKQLAAHDAGSERIKIADKPAVAIAPLTKDLSARKIETISSVDILNDSIVLSLFDNGTIDGDTVSVLLNGKVIISRVGLLATAFNHTIHLTPDMGDSIKLILYAENLGSIPPNTGLLVVRDGGKNHEIRFSGDLKNNSAIILRRNKKR